MKDYLEQLDAFDEGAFLVADGAYSGEMNSRIVASDTLKEECNSCPYKDRCHPRFLKTRVRKEVSWKAVGRAKQLQYMKLRNAISTRVFETEWKQSHLFYEDDIR